MKVVKSRVPELNHIAFLKNLFQLIYTLAQSYGYTITLINNFVISFLKIEWSFICKNLSCLHTKMLCVKFCLNWLRSFVEEDYLNFVIVFSLYYWKGGELKSYSNLDEVVRAGDDLAFV